MVLDYLLEAAALVAAMLRLMVLQLAAQAVQDYLQEVMAAEQLMVMAPRLLVLRVVVAAVSLLLVLMALAVSAAHEQVEQDRLGRALDDLRAELTGEHQLPKRGRLDKRH